MPRQQPDTSSPPDAATAAAAAAGIPPPPLPEAASVEVPMPLLPHNDSLALPRQQKLLDEATRATPLTHVDSLAVAQLRKQKQSGGGGGVGSAAGAAAPAAAAAAAAGHGTAAAGDGNGITPTVTEEDLEGSPFQVAAARPIAPPPPLRTVQLQLADGGHGTPTHAQSPLGGPQLQEQQQQQQRGGGGGSWWLCGCFGGGAAGAGAGRQRGGSSRAVRFAGEYDSPPRAPVMPRTPTSPMTPNTWRRLSPRKGGPPVGRISNTYSDAEWYDARSAFSVSVAGAGSPAPGSAAGDAAANERAAAAAAAQHEADANAMAEQLEEVQQMVRELGAFKAPWVPDPPLAFAPPGLHFIKVPERTPFAAYWELDAERTTPFPQPIDVMIRANFVAQKSHASIPGIWLQETDKQFSVTVKPRILPPGIPRYVETYDKSNATEPSWSLRRDLRMGSTSGQIYLTSEGMLILRARSRPVFNRVHDYVFEEYVRLEEGGTVIVDRMCCIEVATGRRATQYQVGRRHEVPPRGHV